MLPRAVIFDFHNTLFNADSWFELETRRLASAVADYLALAGYVPLLEGQTKAELDAVYAEFRRRVHSSGIEMIPVKDLEGILRGIGLKVERWMIGYALEALEYGCLSTAYPCRGVADCLQTLAESDILMAVLSSALYSPFIEWSLKRYGMKAYFVEVMTSVDAGYYKSEPRLFHKLLDTIGVRPQDAVHVGDSYRFDVEGAKAAGLRVVWVVGDQGAVMTCPANACVNHLANLPAALHELSRLD